MERGAESPIARHRVALLIEYDGVPFNGWQSQHSGFTIQSELQRALQVLTGEEIQLTASGRTDAGVHAYNQVAHFDTESSIPLFKMVRSINGIADDALSVKNAYNVPNNFHSRYDAVSREYVYKFYNHIQKSPFIKNRAWWIPHEFDIDLANSCAKYLIGTHDFASFCKKSSHENGTVRTVQSLEFSCHHDFIHMTIRAGSFIHNMVRIIAGTICEIVREGRSPGTIIDIMNRKERESGGVTAPAYALYLNRITYDPDLSSYNDAYSSLRDNTG